MELAHHRQESNGSKQDERVLDDFRAIDFTKLISCVCDTLQYDYVLAESAKNLHNGNDTLHCLVSAHFDMNWQHEVGVVWSELWSSIQGHLHGTWGMTLNHRWYLWQREKDIHAIECTLLLITINGGHVNRKKKQLHIASLRHEKFPLLLDNPKLEPD